MIFSVNVSVNVYKICKRLHLVPFLKKTNFYSFLRKKSDILSIFA